MHVATNKDLQGSSTTPATVTCITAVVHCACMDLMIAVGTQRSRSVLILLWFEGWLTGKKP